LPSCVYSTREDSSMVCTLEKKLDYISESEACH